MARRPDAPLPLLTRDPATGAELVVTRLESPSSGLVIEGRFSLGWIGRLTPDQLNFVGLLLKQRNNLQALAAHLGIAYNTARSRLDDVVAAVGGGPPPEPVPDRADVLGRLAAGELTVDEAMRQLRKG